MLFAQSITERIPQEYHALVGGVIVFLLLWAYFLPTWVAFVRGHPNMVPIGIVNLVFGWTLLGYVICLAWSYSAIDRRR